MTVTETIDPIYCVKCKAKTGNVEPKRVAMKNGRGAVEAHCVDCNTRKFRIGGAAPTAQAEIPADAYEQV